MSSLSGSSGADDNGLVVSPTSHYSHRSSRRSYTTEEKLAALQKASTFPSLKSASKAIHIPEQCLQRWKEHEGCIRQQAIRNRGLAASKRLYPDKMPTLSRLCRKFLEETDHMFGGVTATALSLKALEIRDDLLHLSARGQMHPLSSHETKAYQHFKASKGWATKFLFRFRTHRDAVENIDAPKQRRVLPRIPPLNSNGNPVVAPPEHGEEGDHGNDDDVIFPPARGEEAKQDDDNISSTDFVDGILKSLIEVEQKLAKNVNAAAALNHLQSARKEILVAFAKAQSIQQKGNK
jgi:hypothetical protein